MKKIFVDIYLSFNLGDDLFLDILSKHYPNSEITINHVGNNYDEFVSKYKNVKRRKYTLFNKVLQKLKIKDYLTDYESIAKKHDALVFIGGSIFREEAYHKSLYKDRMKMVNAFNNNNKPIFIMGSNFGPYKTERFLNEYKEFYKLCTDVCFRDLYSYNLFKDLKNVRYAPDIVFQMDTSKYKGNTKNNTIGYSIIDVHHKDGLAKYYDKYVDDTINSIEMVISKGYDCLLISFCKNEGDLKVIKDIINKLPANISNRVKTYDYNGNLDEALNIISQLKLFIAARFHANILGLLCNVGIVPVIYSNKTSNMLKDINLDSILIDMDNLSQLSDPNMIEKGITNKIIDLNNISTEASRHFEKLNEFENHN